jgi:hypothetical protein
MADDDLDGLLEAKDLLQHGGKDEVRVACSNTALRAPLLADAAALKAKVEIMRFFRKWRQMSELVG